MSSMYTRWRFTILAISMMVGAHSARGHETDPYTVPVGRAYADLGPYFSRDFLDRIRRSVERVNREIRLATNGRAGETVLSRLRSSETIVDAFHAQFPNFMIYIEGVERELSAPGMKRQYPGLLVAYRPVKWIYSECFFLDPRQVYKLWGSSTILVNGVHLGTDKIGHFVHNGYFYYLDYVSAMRHGASKEEAVQFAVRNGTDGDFFRSEQQLLGYFTSGVFSNADLAANYAGFEFYRGLTEEVTIGAHRRPSLLSLESGEWALRDGVNEHSDFLAAFITEHFDEVLNPNMYGLGMNDAIRGAIARRCNAVLRWYTDENGLPRERKYFTEKFEQLRTFFGESYGARGTLREVIGVVNVCFDSDGNEDAARASPQRHTGRSQVLSSGLLESPLHRAIGDVEEMRRVLERDPALLGGVDLLGRTALHWASRSRDENAVVFLLAKGAMVDAKDADAFTALHEASRVGFEWGVKTLLAMGASPNASATLGITPLLLAVRSSRESAVEQLLAGGADPNIRDTFGGTPLHDSAAIGHAGIVARLLQCGASVDVPDDSGNLAIHMASRGGHLAVARLLATNGSSIGAHNALGQSPASEARAANHRAVADWLDAALRNPNNLREANELVGPEARR